MPAQLGAFVVREHLKFYRKLLKIGELNSESIQKQITLVLEASALQQQNQNNIIVKKPTTVAKKQSK